MTTIRKKIWKKYFEQILAGEKRFDVRGLDFQCSPGDTIIWEEVDGIIQKTEGSEDVKTGREITVIADYIFRTDLEFNIWQKAILEYIRKGGFQIIQFKPPDGYEKSRS